MKKHKNQNHKSIIHQWFKDLLKNLIPENEITDFLVACDRPLKKSITINTTKISVEDFLNITKSFGRTLERQRFIKNSNTFYIDRKDLDIALGRTFLYQAGFFYIQEVAASLSAPQLDLQSGDIILDMAAAPGGKTSQLSNSLLNKETPGLVIANDVNRKRLWTLAHNLNQGGRYNTLLTKFNGWTFGNSLPNFFDHVLLDAPCSGEWTRYKSDFALKFWNQAEINKICGTQLQLLISAIKTTKIWWTIVYSTCTLNPFENEGTLAKAFLFFKESIKLETLTFQWLNHGVTRSTDERSFDEKEKVARCWPHLQKTWGFFIAKIKKLSDPKQLKIDKNHKMLPKNQFKLDQSKGLQKKISKWIQEQRWISIDKTKHFFVASKEKVYLISPDFKKVTDQLHAEKMGVPIAKIDRYGYRPTHYMGNILWHLATKNIIELTDKQAQTYSERKNIPLAEVDLLKHKKEQKYFLLTRKGHGFSTTKIVKEELKNKFSK